MDLGLKKRENVFVITGRFVITEFVITEFDFIFTKVSYGPKYDFRCFRTVVPFKTTSHIDLSNGLDILGISYLSNIFLPFKKVITNLSVKKNTII
jgi:hypothetical protein